MPRLQTWKFFLTTCTEPSNVPKSVELQLFTRNTWSHERSPKACGCGLKDRDLFKALHRDFGSCLLRNIVERHILKHSSMLSLQFNNISKITYLISKTCPFKTSEVYSMEDNIPRFSHQLAKAISAELWVHLKLEDFQYSV